MSAATGAIVLAGRVLFASFFGAVAGVGHIRRSDQMEGYSKGVGFPVPFIAGWPTGLWLIAGAVSIALGIWPDIGALMIAAVLFGTFVALGPALRFSMTSALFDF